MCGLVRGDSPDGSAIVDVECKFSAASVRILHREDQGLTGKRTMEGMTEGSERGAQKQQKAATGRRGLKTRGSGRADLGLES